MMAILYFILLLKYVKIVNCNKRLEFHCTELDGLELRLFPSVWKALFQSGRIQHGFGLSPDTVRQMLCPTFRLLVLSANSHYLHRNSNHLLKDPMLWTKYLKCGFLYLYP